MEAEITEGLDDLERRLNRVRELLEWQRLFESEGPQFAGGFRSNDTTQEEIAVAYGAFISLALDLQAAIDRAWPDTTPETRIQCEKRLHSLVLQCQDLAVPERYLYR
jgi:hypothetical protein